eukprot:TRINITY_DN6063_c0_g1_i1.p1 TRINITY_DN6063_c0_g1~~TRINITY_DN6063_c0_g1_i1.p1  ORF type:complete len:273 (+),score=79.07 TRINITY_DN6063_c0_g1_i1:77-820(+)
MAVSVEGKRKKRVNVYEEEAYVELSEVFDSGTVFYDFFVTQVKKAIKTMKEEGKTVHTAYYGLLAKGMYYEGCDGWHHELTPKLNKCVEAIHKIVQLWEEKGDFKGDLTFMLYTARASMYLQDFDLCYKLLDAILAIDFNNLKAYVIKALALRNYEQWINGSDDYQATAEGKWLLKQATKLEPKDLMDHEYQAMAYFYQYLNPDVVIEPFKACAEVMKHRMPVYDYMKKMYDHEYAEFMVDHEFDEL